MARALQITVVCGYGRAVCAMVFAACVTDDERSTFNVVLCS